jgi:hypothetical protein
MQVGIVSDKFILFAPLVDFLTPKVSFFSVAEKLVRCFSKNIGLEHFSYPSPFGSGFPQKMSCFG